MSAPPDTVAQQVARRFARLLAYRTLLKYLVLKDLKVRSRGTYLGIAWTLVNPLLAQLPHCAVGKGARALRNPVKCHGAGLGIWEVVTNSG